MTQCYSPLPSRTFQMGVVRATLATDLRALLADYAALYHHAVVPEPGTAASMIRVEVHPRAARWWRPRGWDVTVNGRLQFTPTRAAEVLPYVEWAINWEVPRVLPQFLHLHAASLAVGGRGVILPGLSGSGKSTLTAGLLTRGWHYLCDEFAVIHSDTLRLAPYPRAICIKQPSHPVVEALGLQFFRRRYFIKGAKGNVGFIDPTSVRPDAVGGECPVDFIIFPRYCADAKPELVPMHRAEAAFALHEVCFNLFGCRRPGLDVLTRLVRGAQCYRLVAGELNRTCDLLESLLDRDSRQNSRDKLPDRCAAGNRPAAPRLNGPRQAGQLCEQLHRQGAA